MSERVFEYGHCWEVSGIGRSVEVYVFDSAGDVMITVAKDVGYDSQVANFTMTTEEATAMKNFLIKQGY